MWQAFQSMAGAASLHIDGLMQKRRNSSALAMELRLFCINPSIWPYSSALAMISNGVNYAYFALSHRIMALYCYGVVLIHFVIKILYELMVDTPKSESPHDANFVVTGAIRVYDNDNHCCREWWVDAKYIVTGDKFGIITTRASVSAKSVRHFWHFRQLGPNVWWEISLIYIEYLKPIGQMSIKPWELFCNNHAL